MSASANAKEITQTEGTEGIRIGQMDSRAVPAEENRKNRRTKFA